jgi:hypothetical protein
MKKPISRSLTWTETVIRIEDLRKRLENINLTDEERFYIQEEYTKCYIMLNCEVRNILPI